VVSSGGTGSPDRLLFSRFGVLALNSWGFLAADLPAVRRGPALAVN